MVLQLLWILAVGFGRRPPAGVAAAARRPLRPAGIQQLDPSPSVVTLGWSWRHKRPRSKAEAPPCFSAPSPRCERRRGRALTAYLWDYHARRLIFFRVPLLRLLSGARQTSRPAGGGGGGGCSDMRDRCLKHRRNPKKKTGSERCDPEELARG